MRVLIILDHYFPSGNANSVCIKNLINAFGNNDYFILCEGNCDNNYVFENENVTSLFFGQSKKSIFKKVINLIKLIFLYNISYRKVNRFYKKSLDIIKKEKIECVIAVCRPFYTAEVIRRIRAKNHSLRSYIFFFDTPGMGYSRLFLLNKIWKDRTKVFLRKVLSNDTYGIIMNYSLSFCATFLDLKKNNYEVLDLPCYVPSSFIHRNQNLKKTKCFETIVYAGTLDLVYRNPTKILVFLLGVIRNNALPYKILMFSKGCETELAKIKREYPDYIDLCGLVDISTINLIYNEASFLLSIGNHLLDQLPSKVFTYFSTGKPVLNFYFDDSDLSLPYFAQYKNSISIKVDEMYQHERKVGFFLRHHKITDYDSLKKLFKNNQPETYNHIFSPIESERKVGN